jgi:hypothetical protein
VPHRAFVMLSNCAVMLVYAAKVTHRHARVTVEIAAPGSSETLAMFPPVGTANGANSAARRVINGFKATMSLPERAMLGSMTRANPFFDILRRLGAFTKPILFFFFVDFSGAAMLCQAFAKPTHPMRKAPPI